MAVSQLKRLKAQAHEQRQARQKGRPSAVPAAASKNSKPKKQPPKETAQQRSHALRAETLLPEFERRHKVGGIIDRRIGENDPSLAPEKRAAQRYMAESQRQKKRNVFNLEDAEDDEDEGILTHGGKALEGGRQKASIDTPGDMLDDYEASEDDGGSSENGGDATARRERKRKRFQQLVDEALEQRELEPDRKKSKQEVMKEVIAKSKLHKYERQQAREADDDIRAELDRGLPDLLAVLRGARSRPSTQQKGIQQNGHTNGAVHPDRLAQMSKESQQDTEKQYDQRLRQMALDKRAQPTERTKTEEEKLQERADMLLALEADRQKRMRGEQDSGDDEDNEGLSKPGDGAESDLDHGEEEGIDEAREFGLGTSRGDEKQELDVEDEDDFVIDEDLVASGSEVEFDSDALSDEGDERDDAADEEEDAEFLQDILPNETNDLARTSEMSNKGLAYTYPCPQTHRDFLTIVRDVDPSEVPTIIQRIRALYHAQLHSGNKEKLSNFAAVLVEHIAFVARGKGQTIVLESIIRHIHSLSKTYGDAVSKAFRLQLQEMHERGKIDPSDVVTLTAIGSIYPTSDHFHQVVTPAITLIARWLCMTVPSNTKASLRGAYLVALALKYQSRSKRFIPEALRFTCSALKSVNSFTDAALTAQHLTNLTHMMDVWYDQVAFLDIFRPGVGQILALPTVSRSCPELTARLSRTLEMMCSVKELHRRPLELHHHRPLPIKMSIPKFEENFNPGSHYEPDREKAEAAKLRKEYKREKKGALRELRRDAEFLARQQLQDKKERDRAYEAKQRRIIGEIQREEGHERNEYEREKRRRKGRF